MKALSRYKALAVKLAKKDSEGGFSFHVSHNPTSVGIDELTAAVMADGHSLKDAMAVESEWECSLYRKWQG